jgi:hypothetical protein
MMQSVCHGKPIVQGEVARQVNLTLGNQLETRDLAAQRRQLEAARVKYIVLHRPQGAMFHWPAQDGDPAAYPRFYRPLHDSGDMAVLRVY